MHDENLHNDPLERLFQKKAGEFDIPFREEDWQQLEKQLDMFDLQRAYRRKVRALAAAAILIVSLLGYFTYENHSRLNQLAEQMESEQPLEMENILPDSHLLPENEVPEDTFAEDADQDFEDENQLVNAKTPVDAEGFQRAERDDQMEDVPASVYADYIEQEVINAIPLGAMYSGRMPLLADEKVETVLNYKPRFDSLIGELAYGSSTQVYISDDISRTELPDLHASRFAIGAAVSPDVSTAGRMADFQRPGYKFGISAEYRLTRNLYLTGGVLASNVRYSAQGSRYNPPGYWNTGITPDETSAVCLLLDIPLGIKYNVFNFEGSRLYTTARLSSYIMLNEKYRFDYEGGYNSLEQELSVRNGSRHFLNNAGFSVGYELDIHPNWSLRAEPFISVPLSGVGWGDVNLYSMGSFVSINFRL